MRFHIRRTIAYGAALLLIFILFLSFTTNEFTAFEENELRFIRANNKRIPEEDLGKWIIKSTHPSRDNMSHPENKAGDETKPSPTPELPLVMFSPGKKESVHLWPDKGGDRILDQIHYIPPGYSKRTSSVKVIYVPAGFGETPEGQKSLLQRSVWWTPVC